MELHPFLSVRSVEKSSSITSDREAEMILLCYGTVTAGRYSLRWQEKLRRIAERAKLLNDCQLATQNPERRFYTKLRKIIYLKSGILNTAQAVTNDQIQVCDT